MFFYVREAFPMMIKGQDFIPSKQIVLFQKTGKGKEEALVRFDHKIIPIVAMFLLCIDVSKENKMHAEILAALLNSKKCTKKLRIALLDSIRNPWEKGKRN